LKNGNKGKVDIIVEIHWWIKDIAEGIKQRQKTLMLFYNNDIILNLTINFS
jgi:hypothetical protein